MKDIELGSLFSSSTYRSAQEFAKTVGQIVDYLGNREIILAKMAEIDRDYQGLQDSRADSMILREKERASADLIVSGLINAGQHELALQAFQAFMNASPNFSAAVVQTIRDRQALYPSPAS